MKNKKDLNIWLLVISLITIITLLLPFAKATEIGDVALWLKIEFYATLGIFIACLVAISVLALISLIKDNFNVIKMIECFVLLAFVMVFVNVLVFGASKYKLNFGQVIVAVEALILCLFSQSVRLISGIKGYGKDFLSLFKKKQKLVNEDNNPEQQQEASKGERETEVKPEEVIAAKKEKKAKAPKDKPAKKAKKEPVEQQEKPKEEEEERVEETKEEVNESSPAEN